MAERLATLTNGYPRYQHTALKGAKAFRLLELQPGENGDVLRCDIKTTSLDERPQYEALSYVWGIPQNAAPGSTVQGPLESIFKVTGTCFRALKALRRPITTRYLWIDQICVDQQSPEEKAHQVRLMGEIYRNASRVIVEPTGAAGMRPLDHGALLCLANWGRRARNEPELLVPSQVQQKYDDSAIRAYEVEPGKKPFLENWCCEVMYSLKWFERAWGVQEVALAKEAVILLGSVEVPFYEVLRILMDQFAAHATRCRNRAVFEHPARLQLHASMRGAPKRSLLELAYNVRSTKTTKPEDKLYSLIGLASDGEDYEDAVHYTRSFEETFTEFSRLFINQSRSLDLLSLINEFQTSPELPSWVVLWHKMKSGYPALLNPFGSGARFNANRSLGWAEKQDPTNLRVLYLRGLVFDTIQRTQQWPSLQPPTTEIERPSRAMKARQQFLDDTQKSSQIQVLGSTIRYLRRQLQQHSEQHAHYANLDKALLNTLTHGQMRDKMDTLEKKRDQNIIEQLFPHPSTQSRGTLEGWWSIDLIDSMAAAWYKYRLDWRFVQTAGGYIGLAPESAVEGDRVCILAGGSVPFVLREVAGAEAQYQLVAPAYVEGIMYGEAMEGKEERDLRDFSLV